MIILAGCGETYRPVATPVIQPGGDPEATHYAVVVSKSGGAANEGRVEQINVSGDTNMGNRDVGVNPVYVAFGPARSRVWVVNQGEDNVSTYVPGFLSVANSTLSLEPNSGGSYISAALAFAFATEPNLNRVALFDANQAIVIGYIPVGANPVAIATPANGAKAYVANNGDNTVSVISTADRAVSTTIPVGNDPIEMTIQAGGAFVYVANRAGNSISVIDTSTDTEIQKATTGVSAPTKLVWDDNLKRLYVVNSGTNSITIFDASAAQLAFLKTVNLAYAPLGVAPLDNGSKFYVLRGGSPGTVDVYDAQSFVKRTTLTVQNTPTSIAASPGSTKVYVANSTGTGGNPATDPLAQGSISIIKTLDDSVLNVAPPGPTPFMVVAQ